MSDPVRPLIKFGCTEYLALQGIRRDVRLIIQGPGGKVGNVRAIVFDHPDESLGALGILEKREYALIKAVKPGDFEHKIYTVFINKKSFQKRGSENFGLFLECQSRQSLPYYQVQAFLQKALGYIGPADELFLLMDPETIETVVRFSESDQIASFDYGGKDFKVVDRKLGTLSKVGNVISLQNPWNIPYLSITLSENKKTVYLTSLIETALTAEEWGIFRRLVKSKTWMWKNAAYVGFSQRGSAEAVVSIINGVIYITDADRKFMLGKGGSAAYYQCQKIVFNTDGIVQREEVAHGIDKSGVSAALVSEAEAGEYICRTVELFQKMKQITGNTSTGLCQVLDTIRHSGYSEDKRELGLSIYLEPLATRMDAHFGDGKGDPSESICLNPDILRYKRRYIIDLLKALVAIHSQGLVHRDIKFQNIMLGRNLAIAKLIDYGEMVDKRAIQGTERYLHPLFLEEKEPGVYTFKAVVYSHEDYKRGDLFGLGLVVLFLEDPDNIYREFIQGDKPAFTYLSNWLVLPSIRKSAYFRVIEGLLGGLTDDISAKTVLEIATEVVDPMESEEKSKA